MINSIGVSNRSIGINFTEDNQAVIRLWVPWAGQVAIASCGSSTTIPLARDEFGYWITITDQLRPGDTYHIVLNHETRRPDPASLCQPEGLHGPSQAVDLRAFEWADRDWINPPLANYFLYELHVGTFTPEGTFAGLERKLDHLKELGINAIELMPVAQFPGSRNWGYDGALPFAVQQSYGGASGLQHLVNACHQKGIAVVLDVVYNHMGPEGNYFREFGPYFTSNHCTPWGDAINFDDAGSDGVRDYFIENALMWFRDFHIDALRLDAVHAIKDFSANHILREIRQHVDELINATGRRHYLIVECDLNDPQFINPLTEHGYGMDAQWIDEFHHALRVAAGGERSGYYADFNGLEHLAKAYRDAYVYDGQYSPHRQRTFGARAETNPGQQFIVFSQNHDQVGNRMLGERPIQLFGFEMAKLLAGAVLVSPFLPMLFMGEEWAEPNPFLYFVSHTEPELAEAVRQGRKREFAAFHVAGEVPDPMAESTFQQSKLQWELLQREPNHTMLRYYQTLIALRKQQPALRSVNRWQLDTQVDTTRNILQLHRWQDNQHILCLMNFSREQQTITMPEKRGQWQKLFDSAEPQWRGPAAAPVSISAATTIVLQPQSILIYHV